MQEKNQTKKEQETKISPTFFEIDLGHKIVKARKWKAKDRKNFKKAVVNELVLNCLEDQSIALSNEEIQYILIEIRKLSISDSIDFEYTCRNCEKDNIKEIAFHIVSINGDISKTFNEIIEYLDNMDINEFDEILNAFNEMKLTIDNTKEFICSCGHKQIFEFDEIPGFFPDSWLK